MDLRPEADLLITNGLILTMDPERRVLHRADLAVRDGAILAIGEHLPHRAGTQIEASSHAVLPGFVNAHMHETLTRGIAEDLPLNRWLHEVCFPLDSALTHQFMQAAAQMNQLEMIRGGTTTFLDIYRFPAACAEVALQSGLRAVLAPQVILDPPGPGESLESAEVFVAEWRGRNSRITPAFGPHAPYSCPPEAFARLARLADEYDVPLHTHLAETRWEADTVRDRYGAASPARLLEDIGVLSPRLSVAHGVHLSQEDIQLLARWEVSVIYCPSSNMKLASGVAPIPSLLQSEVQVGLGTDSNLSNNNLDMFEEMRLGAVLQKLHTQDAASLPCAMVLEMATVGGARALGLADRIGTLEAGKRADIILVDFGQPHLWPLLEGKYENHVEQLVYAAAAADVTHTIVDGRLLMREREVMTMDTKEVQRRVEEATAGLLFAAGLTDTGPTASTQHRVAGP